MKDYHINIFYSDAERVILCISHRDACPAFGKTLTDALKQAQLAKKVWLEAAPGSRQTHPQTPLPTCHLSN